MADADAQLCKFYDVLWIEAIQNVAVNGLYELKIVYF